jgi:hypothetical protein
MQFNSILWLGSGWLGSGRKMASNMEEAPRQNPQQSLEPDLDAAGPSTKKAKAKRQWKVGTLPDSRTPIRAGTNVKTPKARRR